MPTSNDTTGFASKNDALQFVEQNLGVNTDSADAADDFELLLNDWPFGDDERLNEAQIADIRRALA